LKAPGARISNPILINMKCTDSAIVERSSQSKYLASLNFRIRRSESNLSCARQSLGTDSLRISG
jgi:hypothetical protein